MKRADVSAALNSRGCRILRDTGNHTIWICPCGQHRAPLPRHKETSAGVVRSISRQMACLPEGWLQ